MRGRRSTAALEAPSGPFSELAMQELSLETVKRRHIQAVFFWTRNISRAARILQIDRATVRQYLPDEVTAEGEAS